MSDETKTALAEAVEAHGLAGAAGDPQEHHDTRQAATEAALAHLEDVDPGYHDRLQRVQDEFGFALEPHQRVVAPDLKRAYDEALEAHHAAPDNAKLAGKASELGEQYAAARTAQRVAEGRWEMAVAASGQELPPEVHEVLAGEG
jgi:hypothetical protein